MESPKKLASFSVTTGLLPNLCSLPNVFLTVLLSELLALVFTLLTFQIEQSFWVQLALNSLFVVWLSLWSAAFFCLFRPWLNRQSSSRITLFCVFTVALVTLLTSLLALMVFFEVMIDWNNPSQRWFVLRNEITACLITLAMLRYLYLRKQLLDGMAAEGDARFQALQAKIQPHFLFNTLNTIASLIAIDANRAEQTIEHLAELMRKSLKRDMQNVALDQEINLCRHYLEIEQQRLGERLQVIWEVSEDAKLCQLPPFTLQPLVENAVYHGIQGLSEGGTIHISAHTLSGLLKLEVINPVPEHPMPQGNQLAQTNVKQRLLIRYGDKATMTVQNDAGHYRVIIQLPMESSLEHSDH